MHMLTDSLAERTRYHKDTLKKTIASLVVAVTGKTNIEIMIASGDTRAVADKLYLAELKSMKPHDITLWRGHIDRALFKIAYHDTPLEKKYTPHKPTASLLFTYLMRLRYELQGIDSFFGSFVNIQAVYQQQTIDWYTNEGRGLYYAIRYLSPDLISDNEQLKTFDETKIAPYLSRLQASLMDIESFAKNAAEFAIFFCHDFDDSDTINTQHLLHDDYYEHSVQQQKSEMIASDNDISEIVNPHDTSDDTLDLTDDNMSFSDDDTPFNQTENLRIGVFSKEDFMSDVTLSYMYQKTDYKAYTTDYDLEINAGKLVGHKEQEQLIKEFSEAQKNHVKTIQKLARKLRTRLVSVQNDCRYYDLYEGTLDHHKIVKVLLDPLDGRFFKDDIPIVAENTAITLLIDNSGSMRGKPITMAALCADIIAETVERCGAKVEILGFTTQGWRGGMSRKEYEKSGCPPMPGRLNDLYHIIYKDFNDSYKSAKQSIPVMLKESLLKENIDGEALLWAVNRLSQRTEHRKILTVISDGAPVDDSTNSANTSHYLENHLKKVVHYYENKSDIDVFAIGIGHDVKNYYKKAVTIPNSDALAEALTERFVALF